MSYKYFPSRFCHDYNHCRAIGCDKRDCALYLAYLEAKELNLKDYKCFDHCDNENLNYTPVIIHKKIEDD